MLGQEQGIPLHLIQEQGIPLHISFERLDLLELQCSKDNSRNLYMGVVHRSTLHTLSLTESCVNSRTPKAVHLPLLLCPVYTCLFLSGNCILTPAPLPCSAARPSLQTSSTMT
ncbi:hypothetical protein Y1Q_0003706 [Alligator mississippiensis]|uniref:Uncharacterized protein n=1 Tax=Alligator mississippiensis TaxID=8496 RepID=A0A151MN19_ALLMI|nr:hypothetical protein Y1Q_0003706 [Alligator mississippiensis]